MVLIMKCTINLNKATNNLDTISNMLLKGNEILIELNKQLNESKFKYKKQHKLNKGSILTINRLINS